MAKQQVNINNNSISNTVTNDCNKAICEFIWNGFDAKATTVEIKYVIDELGGVSALSIIDNGEGINRSMLHDTFGCYQDSLKRKTFQWSSQVKGKKGKGRYSFNCFADKAEWLSIYKEKDKLIQHKISIIKGDNHHYDDGGAGTYKIIKEGYTGTIVSFYGIDLAGTFFENDNFIDYLQKEFAIFLQLNKLFDKKIIINGKELDYQIVIADSDVISINVVDEDNDGEIYDFEVTYIRWKKKMKEHYSTYFLDQFQYEKYEKTTSFNYKDNEFHHSLYVISSYFDYFEYQENPQNKKDLFNNKNQKDKAFIDLCKKLKKLLVEKEKAFVKNVAGPKLIDKFENNGIIRKPKNDYDAVVIHDLKDTITYMYEVQPRIFTNLRDEQAKTIVGLLELLLQTDKREDVIKILESIVKLSDDERISLVEVLRHTELSRITETIQLLENRCLTISAIKTAINNLKFGINEVHDIQTMASKAFWMFGEEFNIVTEAEPDFQQALDKYIEEQHAKVKGKSSSRRNKQKLEHPDVNKEMDIFAYRQNIQSSTIDNIVIELKHPNVKLGEVEVSQVKTYMSVITSAPEFNASNMNWKFYLIGKNFDSSKYIEREMESNKHWGRKGLILRVTENGIDYEIYVRKWSDIFSDFEIRHKFLLDKLQLKRNQLTAVNARNKEELNDIVAKANK